MAQRAYVSFDWAAKKLLRQKSNFIILEGFLTALLNEDIAIQEIIESESNQKDAADKFNRVDLLAKNSKDELILVEVQYDRELDYFHRLLYGTSKLIVEHINSGDEYDVVKKVYSIHIVYFDLGQGKDYLYHGTTNFVGVHCQDELRLTVKQQYQFKKKYAHEIFPEYYILKVNDFDKLAVTPLDEWMDFLKNSKIKDDTKVKGLPEAKEQLDYHSLNKEDRAAFDSFIENKRFQKSLIKTGYQEGRDEGHKDGLAEGRAEGLAEGLAEGEKNGITIGEAKGRAKRDVEIAQRMIAKGLTNTEIIDFVDLSEADIEALR